MPWEGKNLSVETRFAQGQVERLPALVEELIQLKVDVLVVGSTLGARAAMRATTTIPIVFAGSSDPVAGGVVTNLARPGGNVTGFSLAYGDGFAGKWLELLKEASNVPHVSVIWNSANAAAAKYLKEVEAAAGILRVRLDAHQASKNSELEVEQPTKFELVVNLMTASTLGLKIPQTLLLRADRLIP